MTDQYITKTYVAELLERLARELRSDAGATTQERHSVPPPMPAVEGHAGDPSPPVPRASSQPFAAAPAPGGRSWTQVGEDELQSSTRGAAHRTYERFEVWQTDDGRDPQLQFGLGYVAARPDKLYYGRPRGYWIVHEMVNRRLGTDLAVFVETDHPTDFVAVIRGNGPNGRSMFDPGDDLPAGYENLVVDVFRDRVIGPQAYGKLAAVAEDGDRQVMLNHAAIQLER